MTILITIMVTIIICIIMYIIVTIIAETDTPSTLEPQGIQNYKIELISFLNKLISNYK